MGRYKFPGKPMKHVHKKRVNVLSCPSTKTNETSIDCNEPASAFDICDSDWDSYKTVNMQETLCGKQAVSEERKGNTDEPKIIISLSTIINNSAPENKSNDCERLSIVRRANKPNTFLYKNYHLKHDNLKSTRKRLMKKDLRIVSKVDVHESVTKKITSCNTRRSLYRRKKKIKDKSLAARMHDRDSTNLVGKFVLPSKSLHSSRVIIPNKRFINSEQVNNNKNEADGVSKNRRKTRADKKIERNIEPKVEGSPNRKKLGEETRSVIQNNVSNDTLVCNKSTSEICLSVENNSYSIESSKDSSDVVVIDSTGSAPKSCSKLILRKARLQLRTHVSEDMDGPFSSYSASAPNPPGTVTCGVCGAVRFYRFVKQARKFNIYSCESCRKFISKMIKRQSCSITTLVCHKGQGMCHVPPIVRSQQWKLLRCAYKARCPACWLKMCLQSFQMPSQLKLNLTNMLPENMRINEDCNKFDIVPDLNKLYNSQETQNTDTNDASQIKLQEQLGKGLETSISPVKLDILSSKTDTLLKDVKNEKRLHKPRTRVATLKKSIVTSKEPLNTTPDCTKRQKIDLKGPRVKHVCRSASIVLGQPIATFSSSCHLDNADKNRSICEASGDTGACINCTSILDNDYKSTVEEECLNVVANKTNAAKESDDSILSVSANDVCSSASLDFNDEAEHDVVKHHLKPVITISSDYFDNYDSESKIYSSGFGLIGSEPFAIQAVCFYCGSAGQEQLLFCACCCEPYHFYCINDSVIHRYLHNNYKNTQFNVDVNTNSSLKLLWKCSRCSICYKCGKSDKPKTTCQLCHRHFHSECMQSDWDSSTKPAICSLCSRCEDCGSQNLTTLASNLFLCSPCFKMRMQEKFCVLCQTYDEKSNSKFVKCGSCLNIIHAECEKLTDEMYEIIHHLPLSSTYLCSTCSSENHPSWKDNVNMALKNGFHIILRLLTRNPSARNIMKWNLFKNIHCSCGSDNTFKKISYSSSKNNEQDSENIELNTVLKECASENILDESQYINYRDIEKVKHKDNNFDISLKSIRKKFCIKECSVRIKNCLESKKRNISNNIVKVQNNECDKYSVKNYEKKISMASCKLNNAENIKSHCNKHDVLPIFLLLNIKRKINTNIYKTVKEFHFEVQQVLKKAFCHELLNVLDCVIRDTFPWYNPQSLIGQENEIIIKTTMNITKTNTLDCENTISSRKQTLSALLKERVEKAVSNVTENNIDTRVCVLCHKIGDGTVSLEGRLLYCGQDEWIHINCAFWSTQVYEELDCSLQNVHEVIFNSRKYLCSLCKEIGASVACSVQRCNKIYHYMCARVANCFFLSNKTVCCTTHYDPATHKTNIINVEEFEMQRPIYIQVDIKKNRHVELSKVQYLIGCLNVTNLGTFHPPLSDTEEAIIPSEFVCSRLFWSTTEPWKIIRYTINTSIFIPTSEYIKESENNFTVDHSYSGEIAQKVEISHRSNKFDYLKYKNKLLNAKDYENESMNITDDDKIVLQVLENLLELICSKEVEETCDDEPQNTADILPPELKDAIFEDLPHDLLDGISVQDIFPKLMSYEDIITADLKLADCLDSEESIRSISSNSSCNNDLAQLKSRKSDLLVSNDLWLEPKYSIHSVEDYPQSEKDINGHHLNRSKSEVFTGIKKITRACSHQRSCSLTWSCKLDNSRPPSTKKRKLTCAPKNVADISNNLFMLVDGSNEKNSMLQELRLSDSVLMSTNVDCLSDTVRELKYCLEENQEIEHEKENNCRAWRNKSQSRIVQLDGADDSSSDNESCAESTDQKLTNLNKSSDEPVQCDKCQCTYRTLTSYKRHLTICASMSSSESESENEELPLSNNISECISIISNETVDKTQNCVTSNSTEISIVSQYPLSTTVVTSTVDSKIPEDVSIVTVNTDNNYIISCSQSSYIPPLNIENNKNTEIADNTDCTQVLQNVHVNEYVVNDTEIVTSTICNSESSNDLSSLTSFVENSSQKLPIPKMTTVKKVVKQRSNIKARTSTVAIRSKKLPVKRTKMDKNIGFKNFNATQIINANKPIRLPEVQNNGLGPTIIIQNLSSPNLMPAYVEAFQQQTGQNLQCIATIVPNEYKSTPFITSNSYVPSGFQLQTNESSNLLSIPTDGFSVIPGLDSMSHSRTMLSPFMHQNRPASNFQCGMVSAEQLFVGSMPTVDPVINDIHNSLYLSPSPVYYGFEAIVQNTVMSSQQYVSSTLPGVLSSNSSYSATTTQVFQSSKLEPIVDMNGTSYIVVNSTVPQVPPPITVNQHPLLTTFQKQNGFSPHPQQSIMETSTTSSYPVQIVPMNDQYVPIVKPVIIEPIQTQIEPIIPCVKPDINPVIPIKNSNTNKFVQLPEINTSIATSNTTLPCDTENKIFMNMVTPTVQVSSASQVLKPTNRVLPMQTQPPPKPQPINNKVIAVEPPNILNKLSQTVDKIQETLQNDVKSSQSMKLNSNNNQLLKLESASLKLVFQKQSEDGIYKISNKYISKKKVPIKVVPVKKTKVPENEINTKTDEIRELKTETHHVKILPKPENGPCILYQMTAQDGYDYSSTSCTEIWRSVFNAVQSARADHKLPLLPEASVNAFNGLQLLGLNSNGLKYLIEQLPGVDNCVKYKPIVPKKINFPEYEENTEDKTFRAARCELYIFDKQPYDMFSWLASEHRNLDYVHQTDYDFACRRASSINLPMAMRFRQLKETSKQTVGVYRSGIHGRGLFCLRDIECGEMVVEYAGEVIRSTLTDKREKYYNSKGIGCYMFRVDDNFVIDATMKGNAARFINHSCDPNCYSRVLEILGHKHILIFALRKIIQGEELTYDYKFPFEEDKIPCTCGAKRCRKYLN